MVLIFILSKFHFNAILFFSLNDRSYSCFRSINGILCVLHTYFRISPSCEEVVRVLAELAKRNSEYITRKNLSSEKDEDELISFQKQMKKKFNHLLDNGL